MSMNPIQNGHRLSINPVLSNPEKFVGTSYPKKYEFGKKSCKRLSVKSPNQLAPAHASQIYCY